MIKAREFWLVLQFPDSVIDFDTLIEVEDTLRAKLDCLNVDGHDMGSGEANIFVVTSDAVETFEEAKKLIPAKLRKHLKAGYREGDSDYVALWPPGLKEFKVI